MHMRSGPDSQRYNEPLQNEVAAIFTAMDGAADVPNDIVIQTQSNVLKIIPCLSPNSDPMCYPLLYPTGAPGWTKTITTISEPTDTTGVDSESTNNFTMGHCRPRPSPFGGKMGRKMCRASSGRQRKPLPEKKPCDGKNNQGGTRRTTRRTSKLTVDPPTVIE